VTTFAGRFDAITFDFYNTLAQHRTGHGRGHMLMEYLREHGFESDPWEHQVLYDVFAADAADYDPASTDGVLRRHRQNIAERVFRRLNVRAPPAGAAEHADDIWNLLGPSSLVVFPDVLPVLARLNAAGLRLAIISNWQCGLGPFCGELGLRAQFRHVLASAEVGHAKPDPQIFHDACRRLGVPAHRVLHVGDSPADDLEGGRRAGVEVILVCRDPSAGALPGPSIPGLSHLPRLLGID